MKKNLLAVAFATTAVLSMSHVFAAAGTVSFTGEILDAACTVDVASQNQTVELGKYNKSEFPDVNIVTAAKNFNIILKNCPSSVQSAKVRFDGTPDTVEPTLLAIDSSVADAAEGVAINLMTADKADLPLHSENNYSYTLTSDADNVLGFYAQYKSTSTTVKAGPANSVANFSVVYN